MYKHLHCVSVTADTEPVVKREKFGRTPLPCECPTVPPHSSGVTLRCETIQGLGPANDNAVAKRIERVRRQRERVIDLSTQLIAAIDEWRRARDRAYRASLYGRHSAELVQVEHEANARCESLEAYKHRIGAENVKVYICAYRHERGTTVCLNRMRAPVAHVDEAVLGAVRSMITPDVTRDVIRELRTILQERTRRAPQETERLTAEAAKLRREIARLTEALASSSE